MTSLTNSPALGNSNGSRALSPERAAKLELDQLRLAEKNVQPALYALPFFGAVVCVMLSAWVPVPDLFAWFVVLTISGIRYWLSASFLEAANPTPKQVSTWHNWLAFGTFGANIVWMYPLFAFYHQCSETGQLLLTLVAGCSLSAGAVMTASSKKLLVAAMLPHAAAAVISPLMIGTPLHLGLSALAVGLSLFIAYVGWTVHLSNRDLFLTREDKNELIEQLAAAKFESDKARQKAEAASQAKSEFLANMSHELRTPLNAILGFSDLMRKEIFGPLGAHQYKEYVTHVSDSGALLLGLINDVLDLAKIEAGRTSIRPVELSIPELAQQALKMFEVRAADRQVTLKTELDQNLPLLLADERGMHQVLLNLVSNAIKFTRPGGAVTLFAKRKPNGELDLGVRDTGVGIDPADIDAVFAAFGQGRHDIANPEKGTGLGLPITRGLIEAHGGKVSLQSELGKGTTVTCHFPRERITAPQPHPIKLVNRSDQAASA